MALSGIGKDLVGRCEGYVARSFFHAEKEANSVGQVFFMVGVCPAANSRRRSVRVVVCGCVVSNIDQIFSGVGCHQ